MPNGGSNPGDPLIGRGSAHQAPGDAAGSDRPAGRRVPLVPAAVSVPRPAYRPAVDGSWLHRAAEGMNTRLALGILLVVALAVAWVTVGRASSSEGVPPPASTARVSTASTASSRVIVTATPRWVPRSIAATCRAVGAAASNVVVDCAPGRGVAVLRYRAFPSKAALDAVYSATGTRVGGVGPSSCARGTPDERAWAPVGAPESPFGRYRCVLVAGRARLEWTTDALRVLAVATRADSDLRSLYEWWTSVPGPTVP